MYKDPVTSLGSKLFLPEYCHDDDDDDAKP